MAPKQNPLNLNPLQLKTLTLLQALARIPDNARPAEGPGELLVGSMPVRRMAIISIWATRWYDQGRDRAEKPRRRGRRSSARG